MTAIAAENSDSNGSPNADASSEAPGEPQPRLIDATFMFKVNRVFCENGVWIASGWQLSGIIRPGSVAHSQSGAAIAFGVLRMCGRGDGAADAVEFSLQGAPQRADLIQFGSVLHGEYTVELPPFQPVGVAHKPSLAQRRAQAAVRARPPKPHRARLTLPDDANSNSQEIAVWSFR